MAQGVAQRLALGAYGLGERLPTVAAWMLGFVPLTVLAFQGGGYDAVIRSQAGIAVWWILALGCLVGAITPALPSRRALVAAGLLAALGVWSWIGITVSESPERTLSEVARIATYLGVLLLGLLTLDRRRAPTVLLGVASAIVLVAGLAVLSRLQPGLFPANETGAFLSIAEHRLNWPLNYWNGLAALCALGVPLALALAAGHRHVALRALGAAALPVLALCISLTIARGGIAAAAIGVVVLLFAAPMRLRVLASLGVGGLASAILVAAAAQRGLVHEDLRSSAALQQGDELTVVMLVVVAGAGLVQAGIASLEPFRTPPFVDQLATAPARLTRRQVAAWAGLVLLLAIIVGIAAGVPERLTADWNDFKSPASQAEVTENNDPSRLRSLSSNGRYQLWSAAVESMRAHPVLGTGAGTYEFTWLRYTAIGGTVQDAHSLYLELGAETGIPGFLLGLAFIVALLSAGRTVRRMSPGVHLTVASALAGMCSFAFSAAVDWVWELPAVALATMLLGAVALTAERSPAEPFAYSRGRRFAFAAVALIPLAVLTVVLARASSIEASRAYARSGSLVSALDRALDAHAVDPAAATPLIQSALVREQGGDIRGALTDARGATRRERMNWRSWLVLSRLEARAGRPRASVVAFRRARALDPNHPILRR